MSFRTLLADPPWSYNNKVGPQASPSHRPNSWDKSGMASSSKRYGEMALPDLMAIPVADLMDRNSHLYLWTTNSMTVEAHQLARAWGFEPKTMITWVKVRSDGSGVPSMKMGFYYRSATEHCLFCVRGRVRLTGPPRPTCFLHPRLPHSVKPDTIHQWAEEQSPPDHVELFARRERNGWVTIGKEIGTWLW